MIKPTTIKKAATAAPIKKSLLPNSVKCKGNDSTKCNIIPDVELDGFIFDKCEECYGVFNYRKTGELLLKPKKDSTDRVNKPKIEKEKTIEHIFNYHWYLKDGYPEPKLKGFSTFSCGGGSTMGMKLAGVDVLGCVEIDKNMFKCYVKNHNPKYGFNEGIKEFVERIKRKEAKKEFPHLFNLDIFDGSPPCSSFSLAGLREKAWGKSKKFREGQEDQILDTLFFDFIEAAKILQPKVVIAENVPGILMGDAIEYVKKIYEDFDKAGYYINHYQLNASSMGVPQKRERIFFIAVRKDIADNHLASFQEDLFNKFPKLKMEFNEPNISFTRATKEFWEEPRKPLTETASKYYFQVEEGKSFATEHDKGSLFNWMKLSRNQPAPTLAAGNRDLYFHPIKEGPLNEREYMALGSFPLDYDSLDQDVKYMVGMSVPPVMMAQVVKKIIDQWFSLINKK